MSIPGRVEAVALLLSLDPPAWHLRHSRAVAEVAAWLAARAADRGLAVDRALVESGALLHDADKALPGDHPLRALPHGEGSARWLAAHGCPELAPVVIGHPVSRLADEAWWRRWEAEAALEARLVAYADKRAGQRLESMDARFASWRRRYPPSRGNGSRDEAEAADGARLMALSTRFMAAGSGAGRPPSSRRAAWSEETVLAVATRAAAIEQAVCRTLGIEPGEVGRLRWTGRAVRQARPPHKSRAAAAATL